MLPQRFSHGVGPYVEFLEDLSVLVREPANLEIVRKRFGSAPDTAQFTVIRPLVNFAFRERIDDAFADITPPIELLVRFTKHDMDEANAATDDPARELVFAHYDTVKGDWIRHPYRIRHIYSNDFHGFDGFGGYDIIEIDAWPADPGGAWGV